TYETARTLLNNERETTLEERARLRRELDEYEVDYGMGEGDPGVVERERTMLQIEQLDQRLAEIEAALRRIDEGTYGRCASCGELINPERLEILPFTTLCVTCAGKTSRRR